MIMGKHNIGKLFYRDYYRSLSYNNSTENYECGQNDIENLNNKIFETPLDTKHNLNLGNKSFELTTAYPGLIVGSGYNHEVPDIDEQLKLGFYFDYTSGLPVIPGSSVKGVLRSAFPGYDYQKKKYTNKNHESRKKYICKCLKSISDSSNTLNNIDINKLEHGIFEGVKNIGEKKDKDKYYPISQRDIFYDAVIVTTDNEKNHFLADDYITPHKDPLKNPNPIRFLKVRSAVTIKFQFYLTDSMINADAKLILFKQILLDIGIGAKTAVGYGYFKQTNKGLK